MLFLLLTACRFDPSAIVNVPPTWVRTSDQPDWDCEELDPELPDHLVKARWYEQAMGFEFEDVRVESWQGCLTYLPPEEPSGLGIVEVELQAIDMQASTRSTRVSVLLDDVIQEHLDADGGQLLVRLNGVDQFEAGGSGMLYGTE